MMLDESPTNQSKGKTLDKRTACITQFPCIKAWSNRGRLPLIALHQLSLGQETMDRAKFYPRPCADSWLNRPGRAMAGVVR
jgi:hypothetical protein